MSEPRRVIVAGASGLVGSEVLRLRETIDGLRLAGLARRPVPDSQAQGAEMIVAEPGAWGDVVAAFAPEAVISALGTTWRKAGRSQAGFRAVDRDLVLSLAEASRKAGAHRFVLVSAVGADRASRSFYLRVKGEAEARLARLGFARLDLLRPGLLRGVRRAERRVGEHLAILASPLVDTVLRGSWTRYRSIAADKVAAAALALLDQEAHGCFIHERAAMLRLAERLEALR